jgi:hypothetical protein
MRRGPLVLLVRRIGFTKPSIAESGGAGNVIPVRASARVSQVSSYERVDTQTASPAQRADRTS